MTTYEQGTTATLIATFLTEPGGSPVDPSPLSLSIIFDESVVAGPFTYPGTVDRLGVGLYSYDYEIPQDADLGDYVVTWAATISGSSRTGYEVFTVIAGGSTTGWASTADVLSITGVTVTTEQLAQANAVIEMHAGRLYTDAITRTGSRDIEWMRRACSYQAAWMLSQPDVYARVDMSAISQEGRSVQLKDDALTIAPLAKRALARVSWLKSRSLHVRSPFADGLGPAGVLGGPIIDYDDWD